MSHLNVSRWSEANLVENKMKTLNILMEPCSSCGLSRAHFTCRVYGSVLSYYMNCLAGLAGRGAMKLKFVPGMGVRVRVRVCVMPRMHNTNTQAAGGFNQFPGVRDKSCLVHVSPPAGPV